MQYRIYAKASPRIEHYMDWKGPYTYGSVCSHGTLVKFTPKCLASNVPTGYHDDLPTDLDENGSFISSSDDTYWTSGFADLLSRSTKKDHTVLGPVTVHSYAKIADELRTVAEFAKHNHVVFEPNSRRSTKPLSPGDTLVRLVEKSK